MNIYHNNKNDNDLIIFFSGWGIDYRTFLKINTHQSLLIISDYNSINKFKQINSILSKYKNHFVITWSFGVFVYTNILDRININPLKVIAINGTAYPIDNNYGIPERIFNITASNLTKESLIKFDHNCFDNEIHYKTNLESTPRRDISSLYSELLNLQDVYYNKSQTISDNSKTPSKTPKNYNFDTAYISTNDRIFSYKNQLNYWTTQTNTVIKEINTGHFPFYLWNRWEDLIES